MRINYIDYLKVVALLLMTFYHYEFITFFFSGFQLTQIHEVLGFIARFLFLFLFGVHYRTYTAAGASKFLKLALAALIITLFSTVFFPSYTIVFGVIHFFLVCSLLFRFYQKFLYVLGYLSVMSLFIQFPYASNNWFLILGFTTSDFMSFDYFPIFPYFSYVFAGIAFNDYFISKNKIPFDLPKSHLVRFVAKHSLLYYLLHVPIILLVRYMTM